jgi:hypothetical protein
MTNISGHVLSQPAPPSDNVGSNTADLCLSLRSILDTSVFHNHQAQPAIAQSNQHKRHYGFQETQCIVVGPHPVIRCDWTPGCRCQIIQCRDHNDHNETSTSRSMSTRRNVIRKGGMSGKPRLHRASARSSTLLLQQHVRFSHFRRHRDARYRVSDMVLKSRLVTNKLITFSGTYSSTRRASASRLARPRRPQSRPGTPGLPPAAS